VLAAELPAAQHREHGSHRERKRPADKPCCAGSQLGRPAGGDNGRVNPGLLEASMSDSLKTLLIIAFLILILWNLGAGLYYMLVDRGTTKRTVNALTRRIALSVALILLVILAIWMGWITPHGING
jgi:hypothetical protein